MGVTIIPQTNCSDDISIEFAAQVFRLASKIYEILNGKRFIYLMHF